MKRFASLLLALVMLVSLTACDKGGLDLNLGGADKDKESPPPVQSSNSDKQEEDNQGGSQLIEPDEDGVALGYEGDTLHTEFFDMTINNPYTCEEFDGLTPNEGYKFLVAELTVYNHTMTTQPMMDVDFEVIWDLDDDDAWAWPECDETQDENGEPVYSIRSEQQLPVEYDLGIRKTVTGLLLYQVPEDAKDFFIAYYEVYAPVAGSDEPEYGDSFYVRFSA